MLNYKENHVMMQFSIARNDTPVFAPTTITIMVDTLGDMVLVTNLFSGVPTGVSDGADALGGALRDACNEAVIAQRDRKDMVGYNWGRKLREALATVDEG